MRIGVTIMSIINNLDPIKTYNNLSLNRQKPQNNSAQKESQQKDKISKQNKNKRDIVYENPKKVKSNNLEFHDPIKRPIRVDDSNNIFYINHNGENKTVKVDAGKYNLTELSSEIQRKVNETFGIGKVSVEITGSGSDRVIRAEDKILFDFLDKDK